MKISNNRVIEVNDLLSRFFNHDHDGDSMIALAIHSEQARKDAMEYMFVKNKTEFTHTDELLIDFEHETIYSAYMLSYEALKENKKIEEVEKESNFNTLKELDQEMLDNINYNQFISLYNLFHKGGVPFSKFNGKPISFFEIIINKLLDSFDFEKKEVL
jgi:DNA-directed RNA polymerase beta' subunit